MSGIGAEDDYDHSPPGLGGGEGDDEESPTTSEASGLGQAAADLDAAIARPT